MSVDEKLVRSIFAGLVQGHADEFFAHLADVSTGR
jgi:hypothetical protein